MLPITSTCGVGAPAIRTKEFDVGKQGWCGMWQSATQEPLKLFRDTAVFPTAVTLVPREPNKDMPEITKRVEALLQVLRENNKTTSFVPTLKRQAQLREFLPNAEAWWSKYFEDESNPVQATDLLRYFSWPRPSQQMCSSVSRRVEEILDSDLRPWLFSTPESVRSVIGDVLHLEDTSTHQYSEDTDYRLYYQSNKPLSKSTYMPKQDTEPGMYVLLMFLEKEQSHCERGWEIARVISVRPDDISIEYLAPNKYNDPRNPCPWPEDWVTCPLVGFKVIHRGKVQVALDKVDHDLVQWGFRPNKTKTVPMKLQPVLLEQIKRVLLAISRKQASTSRETEHLPGFVDDEDDDGAVLADELEQEYEEFERSESGDSDQD